MVKDETVLDSLQGLPQPRGQHYEFAHVAMSETVRSDPEGVVAAVRESGAGGLVTEVWKRCRQKFPSSEDRVDIEGLSATVEELPCGRSCVLITLPSAERMGEAHMIAAVVMPAARILGLFKKSPAVRYFALEVSFDSDQKQTTALCEWAFPKGGGRIHNKLSIGLAVEKPAFLAAVDEQVS
jgi:hypothetical protein